MNPGWTMDSVCELNASLRADNKRAGLRPWSAFRGLPNQPITLEYCAADEVRLLFEKCLDCLNFELAQPDLSVSDLCAALARFWVGFIGVIHPFVDGNGRTAKTLINRELQRRGFQLKDPNVLEINFLSALQSKTLDEIIFEVRDLMNKNLTIYNEGE